VGRCIQWRCGRYGSSWLPTTHEDYFKKLGKDVEDLGPNLTGTKLGLAVPSYMEINSIEDLKK